MVRIQDEPRDGQLLRRLATTVELELSPTLNSSDERAALVDRLRCIAERCDGFDEIRRIGNR